MKILRFVLLIVTVGVLGYSLMDSSFEPPIEVLFLLGSALFIFSGIDDIKKGKKIEGYLYTFIWLFIFIGTIVVVIIR
ncbi:hypothetical protein VBD025_16125 [Virgibacillus flavescens]|uniref:hypothetical protein n=1 Tax=Virgibacillus flavescens TaxID=1611422 RepID=UPI003D33EE60